MRSPDHHSGKGVRIAVIDSGVHTGHPHIDRRRIVPGVAILPDGTICGGTISGGTASGADDATLDRLGHGTAVTAAIQEKAPDAEIIPVRVFHDALKTSSRALTTAIEWSLDARADVVNLSLGTMNPVHRELFTGLVARAREQGTLIVAAREANGQPCWPGALDGVLGVGLDWDVPRDGWRVEAGVFYASGYPRAIPGVAQRHNLHGISFATAQASGFAACACEALREAGGREATANGALIQSLLEQPGPRPLAKS